jgi:glycosyltransferase involved in cell wall biosynthesis
MQRAGVRVGEFTPQRLLFQSHDVLHFHWPEHHFLGSSWLGTFLKSIRFFTVILTARLKGMRIVWTAHNTKSHAQAYPRVEAACRWLFYRSLSGIISLNGATEIDLKRNCLKGLNIPMVVIPHGHYRDVYPDTVSKTEARNFLGLKSEGLLVFGWVGLIKRYKGLPELVSAWTSWRQPEAALLIAGAVCDDFLGQSLEAAASVDSQILFRPGWVDEDKVQIFVKAADVVVLPYQAITNSGAALLALSFGVPVALPHTAPMEELRRAVGGNWVFLYEGPVSSSVLSEIQRWVEGESRNSSAPLENLSWDRLGEQTAAFFDKLCSY